MNDDAWLTEFIKEAEDISKKYNIDNLHAECFIVNYKFEECDRCKDEKICAYIHNNMSINNLSK